MDARCELQGKAKKRLSVFFAVTTIELLDAAGRVDEFLLASEEGVALGANTDVHVLYGSADFEDVTAGAGDGRLFVVGMDLFFHYFDLIQL